MTFKGNFNNKDSSKIRKIIKNDDWLNPLHLEMYPLIW